MTVLDETGKEVESVGLYSLDLPIFEKDNQNEMEQVFSTTKDGSITIETENFGVYNFELDIIYDMADEP